MTDETKEPNDETVITAEQPETPAADAVLKVTADTAGEQPATAPTELAATASGELTVQSRVHPQTTETDAKAAESGIAYQGKRELSKLLNDIYAIGESVIHNAKRDILWTETELKALIHKIHSEL